MQGGSGSRACYLNKTPRQQPSRFGTPYAFANESLKEDQQGTVDSAVLGSAMLIAFGHCFLPTIIVKIRKRSAEADVRDFHGRQLSEDRAIYRDDHRGTAAGRDPAGETFGKTYAYLILRRGYADCGCSG